MNDSVIRYRFDEPNGYKIKSFRSGFPFRYHVIVIVPARVLEPVEPGGDIPHARRQRSPPLKLLAGGDGLGRRHRKGYEPAGCQCSVTVVSPDSSNTG